MIVDDEQSAIDILSTFVARIPFLSLAGSTTNPLEALAMLQNQPINLLFLDIHMPQLSGLDFLKLLKGQTQVVLTTAYSEFAIESYELGVLDYLLKPITFERFLKTAQKALNAALVPSPLWQPEEKAEDYIFFKTESKGKMIKLRVSDIVYVEGLKNYVSVNTLEESVITLLNIKDLEERLPSRQFMRVHKSYIVSLDKISAIDGNQIFFKGLKAYVPLGETYRPSFFEVLHHKMMGTKK
ncbi:LytR/AlgR family response regulator transcription factor [Hymenobacter arcticus]